MHRVRGISHPQTEPAPKGEVRWIERLQQRRLTSPVTATEIDSAEAGSWIRRLQERVHRAL
jgi:hypothetical protein